MPFRRFLLVLGVIALLGLTWRVGLRRGREGRRPRHLRPGGCCGDAIYYSRAGQRLSDGEVFTHPVTGGPDRRPPAADLARHGAGLAARRRHLRRSASSWPCRAAVSWCVIGLPRPPPDGDRAGIDGSRGPARRRGRRGLPQPLDERRRRHGRDVHRAAASRRCCSPSTGSAPARAGLRRRCWVRSCGLAALARAASRLLLGRLVVAPVILARPGSEPLRRRLVHLLLAGGAALVVLAPWSAYNLRPLRRADHPVHQRRPHPRSAPTATRSTTGPASGSGRSTAALDVDRPRRPARRSRPVNGEAALDYISQPPERPAPGRGRPGRPGCWSVYAPEPDGLAQPGRGPGALGVVGRLLDALLGARASRRPSGRSCSAADRCRSGRC